MDCAFEGSTPTSVTSGEKERRSSLVGHYLLNLTVGSLWACFAYVNIRLVLQSSDLDLQTYVYLALFLRNTSLTILFFVRRPAKATSTQIKEWLVAALGTVVSFFYVREGTYPIILPWFYALSYLIMLLAGMLSIFAILSLGRSFGIVPANRGIKTGGPYGIVRHPIYACYIGFDTSFVAVNFSWLNLALFSLSCVTLYLRALYEERFLRQDATYRQYAEKTRYMFFPKIL